MTTTRNRRLKKLEQKQGSAEERIMVMFTDWEPGEEPPDEEIMVNVSYSASSTKKPEKMTYAEYKRRFPDWETETERIVVTYGEDGEE